jgi:hypothetical protein
MLTLISSLLLAKSTHIYLLLPTIPHPYNSHFYKLRTFVVLELFFLYDPTNIKKTLFNLTRSCCDRASLPSHIHMKSKHKNKERKKTYKKTHSKQKKEIK